MNFRSARREPCNQPGMADYNARQVLIYPGQPPVCIGRFTEQEVEQIKTEFARAGSFIVLPSDVKLTIIRPCEGQLAEQDRIIAAVSDWAITAHMLNAQARGIQRAKDGQT